jgi:DNA invertase Pin-like site-specific DNA recombinase
MSCKKAYSYARFSTPEQLDGRSLKRQLAAAQAYCQRHGLTLDEKTFTDLGLSGYTGSNVKGGELATFLEMVKEGFIPRGSTLIVENMDRISRLPPHEANEVILAIVKAGVNIATTNPEQLYTLANIRKVETWIPLQVAQCLASAESEKKSERLADAWSAKRDELANGHKMSKRGPAWLKLSADRKGWLVLEDKAKLVRRIFDLAITGHGGKAIAGILNQEAPGGLLGRAKGWEPAFVCYLLRSRSVLGEFQPHTGKGAKKGGVKSTRKPFGEPIKGYFPAIVSEADFYRVQEALDKRRAGGGRTTGTPNLFNGFCHNAVDGWKLVLNSSYEKRVYVSSGAVRKMPGCAFRPVDAAIFEKAILSRLVELKPADVLARTGKGTDKVAEWSGRLVVINRNLATMQKQAAVADDASAFIPIISDLAQQRKEAMVELDKAKSEAASREGDALGETQSLIRLLEDCEGAECHDLRRKVRAALRRLVESIWVVIVARERAKVVAIQLWFSGGKRHRDYLLVTRPGTKHAEGQWRCWSFAEVLAEGDLDLRLRDHAARLEVVLQKFDLSDLTE